MNQWISSVIDYIYPAMIRNYVLEYVFPSGSDGNPDRQKIDAAMEDVRRFLGIIDETLSGNQYLAGDELSLADFFLAPIIFYVSNMQEGKEAVGDAPSVQAWHQRIANRSSYQATFPPPPAKAS